MAPDTLSFDIDEDDLAPGLARNQTVTWGADWTVSTIIDQLARERFDLEPTFQRRDVWDDKKRSRFIESLVLGIPVPQVILAERPGTRGKFIVLDGKQRLRSLQMFAGLDGQPMRLTGLEVLKHLNGATMNDLRNNEAFETSAAALENQSIRAVVLRGWESESLLYLTFLRLNTNVVGLSPQELRRALHPGPYMDFVMEFSSESASLHRFLGTSGPDFRMRDAEILIRHIGLTLQLGEYRGDLRRFLDLTCEDFNRRWSHIQPTILSAAVGLNSAIDATHVIFGRNAFRRYSNRGYETRKNRAVLDIMAFYFQHEEVREAALHIPDAIRDLYQELSMKHTTFNESLAATTKTVPAVYTRLTVWGLHLADLVPEANRYVPSR